MIELEADLWEVEADVRCITTNGTVNRAGYNIMGGGCAFEATQLFPGIADQLGAMIRAHGNRVFLLRPDLVSFPTKEDVQHRSTRMRILQSAYELIALTNLYGWQKVALPRPGCGLGGLRWDTQVGPLLHGLLDDRFLIIDYPRRAA